MYRIAILKDEQTLSSVREGDSATIVESEDYLCEGFGYTVYELADHNQGDAKLFLVRKFLTESGIFDTYVCYMPADFTPGNREDLSSFFGDDGAYLPSIFSGEVEYVGLQSVNCTVKMSLGDKPGFVTEYQTEAEVDNPRVFMLETVNEENGDSYIVLLQGYQVQNSEVELL